MLWRRLAQCQSVKVWQPQRVWKNDNFTDCDDKLTLESPAPTLSAAPRVSRRGLRLRHLHGDETSTYEHVTLARDEAGRRLGGRGKGHSPGDDRGFSFDFPLPRGCSFCVSDYLQDIAR